ncbi:unnamed protein product [Linum tenue]|uniref:Uncharacterized protein n=1 Tax=Linum tenue TaxID=586396 RepID=A0AAV0QJF4_9ROSI|nr:unnamed protein product [Linum tenue]
MKSVTGEIVSSTPVSLSKAASILSQFVSADTGASQAVNAYLRRANSAFDELVRLRSKSERRARENHRSGPAEPSALTTTSVPTVDERVQLSKGTAQPQLNSEEPHKRKKKKEEDEVKVEEELRKGEGNVEEEELSNKKKTKKSDLGTSGGGENKKGVEVKGELSHAEANLGDLGSESDKQKKKKKKHKSKGLENGDVDGYKVNGAITGAQDAVSEKKRIKEEEQKSDGVKPKDENRKKRKSGENGEESRDNSHSEERPRKKKR